MRAETIFLAFANSDTESLSTLVEEDNLIYALLSPLALKGNIIIHRDSKATTDSICHHLAQYRDTIRLFLYSGHAGRDKLLLEDKVADSTGIAHLLSQCPRLQLVFLNGCSTKGQVQNLLDKGIPAVLATSAPIEDHKAKDFSKRFFSAMKDQNSIQQAFELAKGELLTKYPGENAALQGELTTWGIEETNETLWGLYFRKEEVLHWKFPSGTAPAVNKNFTPNKKLFSALVEALTPYNEKFAKIKENEAFGVKTSEGQKFNLLMASLPHIISGQLSKILAPPKAGSQMASGFATLGLKRLQQLVVIYETIMELFGASMLAQFWELQFETKEIKVNAEKCKLIEEFINLDLESRQQYPFARLILAIKSILDENEVPFFMPELQKFILKLNDKPKVLEATRFLEDLKNRLKDARLESAEAANLCIPAEENLAELLKEIGFLANYMLASVKDISVLKYRHISTPRFQHHMVKLIKDGASDPYEDFDINEKLLDCKSVLIYRDTDDGRKFLNLSPFLIDENAFDPEANINKLFFFLQRDANQESLSYKHVYKPTDPILTINGETNQYNIVKIQFEAFLNFLAKYAS